MTTQPRLGARVQVEIDMEAAGRRWPRAIAERLNGTAGEVAAIPFTFYGIAGDWRVVRFDLPVRFAAGGEKYPTLTLRAADLKELP